MKDWVWYIVAIALAVLFLMYAGCAQIIVIKTDDLTYIKANTIFKKKISLDKLDLDGILKAERYTGESQEVTVITPYGTLKTGD